MAWQGRGAVETRGPYRLAPLSGPLKVIMCLTDTLDRNLTGPPEHPVGRRVASATGHWHHPCSALNGPVFFGPANLCNRNRRTSV